MPLHPALVHLPMALAVLVPLVAIALLIAWWQEWLPARAWWLAVALQAVLVGTSVWALRTGEAEEERVEEVVPESAIEHHEELAERFTWAGGATLLLMGLAGAFRDRGGQIAAGVAIAASAATLAVGYQVGHAGGELVYTYDAAAAYDALAPRVASRSEEHEEHDDDD